MSKPRGNEDYIRGYKRALVVTDKALMAAYKEMDDLWRNDHSGERQGFHAAYRAFLDVVKEVGPPGD